jgi:hypothetical protein
MLRTATTGGLDMNRRRYLFAVTAVGLSTVLAGTALAATAGSSGKPAPVRVTLTVSTTSAAGGDPVYLKARAKLPRGDRLLLQQRDQGARAWSTLGECGTSTCRSQWTEAGVATDVFRAVVVKRKRGAAGPIVQTLGKSKTVTVTWSEPPPPPPPPPTVPPPPLAPAGHYCGFNDQGKSVCLDVTPDSANVANFVTESIVTCNDSSLWQWRLSFGTRQPITNLGFTYSFSGPLNSGSSDITNIQAAYSIDGTFDTAGNVSGTLALTSISWDYQGAHYDCSSAPYGWKAKLNA